MRSEYIRNFLIAAISVTSLSSQSLSAGQLDPFTYIDHGDTISISNCGYVSGGSLTIPAVIDGKPVTAIDSHAFTSSYGVVHIMLPSSVTSIGSYAFANCAQLKSLSASDGLISVGEYAFSYCESLKSVELPASVTTIGEATFAGCVKLSDVAIPAGLTSMGNGAFAECAITQAVIPHGLATLPSNAFRGCRFLAHVEIPPNVTTIGNNAFAYSGLTEMAIPSTVDSIGTGIFSYCKSLAQVELPSGMSSISDQMFHYCSSLSHVSIPDSVATIGRQAFTASGLLNVRMPAGLTDIGESAFSGCENLAKVTLPEKVVSIGTRTFYACKSLGNAYFLGNAPVMQKEVFDQAASGFKIFISKTSKKFTTPTWYGYPTSLPSPEITVRRSEGAYLRNGEGTKNYGSWLVGKTSTPVTYTIFNTGIRKLSGVSVKMTGPDSSDFVVTPLTKNFLASGTSATFQVTFKPKAKGKRFATLRIMSNDRNEDPFEIEMTGKGLILLK